MMRLRFFDFCKVNTIREEQEVEDKRSNEQAKFGVKKEKGALLKEKTKKRSWKRKKRSSMMKRKGGNLRQSHSC
jgi:hypothetical protein